MFKYNNVEITVHRLKVRDGIDSERMIRKLWEGIPDGEIGAWRQFVKLCVQTDQAKGLPFDPTRLRQADKPALEAAYSTFCDLDKALADGWEAAIDAANKPVDEVGKQDPN